MRTHIKKEDTKGISQIVFVAIVVFVIALRWFVSLLPTPESTSFILKNTFVCERVGNETHHTDVMREKSFGICTQVVSANEALRRQVRILIYQSGPNFFDHPIYDEMFWVTSGDNLLLVDFYPTAGSYEIRLTDGKNTLSSVEIIVP